ncbi:hypothetical protein [Pyrobaculum sp.]|uniref:hypothetical protein n=1 Tax=Pyrobaculum sp. TaxID=2004705 RepID=UPI003163BE35
MRREEYYLTTAPVFATYLGVASGNEALKFASINTAELNEVESRRLFVASLMPTPSSYFLEDKAEAARLFGYALAQEEAGVDRNVLVHSFLESMKAVATARAEARAKTYESITSALGALFLTPLFLLFIWAIGVMQIDPALLYAILLATVAGIGVMAYVNMPRDLNLWRTYEWSLPVGLLGGVAVALLGRPLEAFAVFGLATWAWLYAKDRLWWFSIAREVPPMLRSAAAMLKEGAPPDVILGRLIGKYKTAMKAAYGYFIPSKYFVLAKSMFRAITEAGGATAVKAVEYIQSLVDIEAHAVRKMVKMSMAVFALFIAAVFVLAYSVSTAVKALETTQAVNPFFSPPPYEEVRSVVSTMLALVTASFITVFLMPMGLHKSAALGGAAGAALQQALLAFLL